VPGTEPALAPLRALWSRHPVSPRLVTASESDRGLVVAVAEAARAAWLAALPDLLGRPVVAVVASSGEVERVAADVACFREPPTVLPAWETLPYEHVSPTFETMGERIATLRAWRSGSPPALTLLPVRALLQRIAPTAVGAPEIVLAPGTSCDLEDLERLLTEMGYERSHMVEARGHFAVRGGILDVFPSTAVQPVRIELWGDEVDTIRRFSAGDQRSVDEVAEVTILACRELRPTSELRAGAARRAAEAPGGRESLERFAQGQFFSGMESWLPWLLDDDPAVATVADLFPEGSIVVVCDPKRCLDRAADLRREEEDLAAALARTWLMPHAGELEALIETEDPEDGAAPPSEELSGEPDGNMVASESPESAIDLAGTPRLFAPADAVLAAAPVPVWQAPVVAPDPDTPEVSAGMVEPSFGNPDVLATRLRAELARGLTVVLAVDGVGTRARVRDLLVDEGLALAPVDGTLPDDPTGGMIVVAALSRGFVSSDLGIALLAESDITGRRRSHRRPKAKAAHVSRGAAGAVYGDLREGDYVVHYHHGVGRFEGVTQRAMGGIEREYLVVAYAGSDKLYVPVDQLDAVRKYIGGDTPKLSRMGGSDWSRAKAKVRAAVAQIADELVHLYRERLTAEGHAFPPGGEIVEQAAASFPYVETPDQERAIADVFADMEAPVPMDRLVCGDVGYGKTEIAVRAALMAVADGYQVAVLVPTTVLAQQHYNTFCDRYGELPVRVEVLSRFLTPAQQRKVAQEVAAGKVDVLVGTHRMLSEDVTFARLGLVVVDEEQRFGVKAKERLKELRTSVDVLSMTATPIPRTMELSLTGIRDMSVVNTPPEERQPVLTFVGEFDEQAVAAAVRRELLRDGQVFYVHNRVRSIERAAAQLQRLVPEARIGIAHGQMDEGTLEQVMLAFWDGEFDVLVATTIIESGLDIPRANTLIVDRADLLGLAQLYQLRGRVGRARQRAYAYLFFPPDRILTEEAHERLKVIAEHQDLGSGFAIAMRDLEIRGAGNLLGESQSGHIAAVGFDLYCQLVNEAVGALRGETQPEPETLRIDLPLEAGIPQTYMDKETLRLEAYRRLADAHSDADVEDVREEWADRYGPLPESVENLLVLAHVKAAALAAGVRELVFSREQLRVAPFVPKGSKRMRMQRLYPKAALKEDQELLVVPYEDPRRRGRGAGARLEIDGRAVADWTRELLQELA